jgi:hypothetical protein
LNIDANSDHRASPVEVAERRKRGLADEGQLDTRAHRDVHLPPESLRYSQAAPSEWTKHARPIVEAYFHARYFLDMLVAYGHELDEPPGLMGYGWAAILSLYGLR